MFKHSAEFYDLFYSNKDYPEEIKKLMAIYQAHNVNPKRILDVACGSGEHARLLSRHFVVDGIDLDPNLVRIAQDKNPGGNFRVADMSDFSLPQKYDVVQCLFSSIGYLKELKLIAQTLLCFKNHLEPNGIIIVEPWFIPEKWVPGKVYLSTVEKDNLKVCRMNISERDGNLSSFMFHYLVGTPDGVEHFTENHELGLFSVAEMKSCFQKSGLKVEYDEIGLSGRGLYVAKPG